MQIETSKRLAQIPGIHHGYFDRTGGVSTGLFSSLNVALRAGESVENVIENRNRSMELFQLKHENLSCLVQVHGNHVHVIDSPLPFMDPHNPCPEGDALVTQTPGLALGILTADCAPILLADQRGTVVGAAHGGWRGVLRGVLGNTVDAMRALGAQNIHAAIGPCIQQDSYEVGEEVYQQFMEKDPENVAFFHASKQKARYMMDLPGLVYQELKKQSIEHIDSFCINTYTNPHQYFSCRRATHKNEDAFGCHLSAISIF